MYTQPDRPAGRGRRLQSTPVAVAARDLGVPIEQPDRLRGPEVVEQLREYAPDAVVLAAYGLLIPPAALEIPRLGWLNVHPSLLPLYRGATPVVAPILGGDAETGISIFLMQKGLDDGPVLAQERTPIGPEETAGELERRLAESGARLLVQTLEAWAAGHLQPWEQDDSLATYAPKLSKEDGRLDWTKPARILESQVRAYNPWPVAHTLSPDGRLRILRAQAVSGERASAPGEIFRHVSTGLPAVACGEGALLLTQVQLPGGRPMEGKAFLAGHSEWVGACLGAEAEESKF